MELGWKDTDSNPHIVDYKPDRFQLSYWIKLEIATLIRYECVAIFGWRARSVHQRLCPEFARRDGGVGGHVAGASRRGERPPRGTPSPISQATHPARFSGSAPVRSPARLHLQPAQGHDRDGASGYQGDALSPIISTKPRWATGSPWLTLIGCVKRGGAGG